MGKYLETLYLGDSGIGYKTLIGAAFESDAVTVFAFENTKKYQIDIRVAPFLLDLKEDNGDIIDTIGIDGETSTRITGEPVLSEEEYREIDANHWQAAIAIGKHFANTPAAV